MMGARRIKGGRMEEEVVGGARDSGSLHHPTPRTISHHPLQRCMRWQEVQVMVDPSTSWHVLPPHTTGMTWVDLVGER